MSLPAKSAKHHTDSIDPMTLQVNYHTLLAGSPDGVFLFDVDSGLLVDINARACALFGYSVSELMSSPLLALLPARQSNGRLSGEMFDAYTARVCSGALQVYQAEFIHYNGRRIECEMRLVMLTDGSQRLMHGRIIDVTRRNLDEKLRIGQAHLLEMVARGAPLSSTLEQLVLLIEAQSEGVICTVLLLDDDGISIRPAAAPSLPPAYMASLDGAAIGPHVGSCGSAMFRGEAVIVADIMNDPLWAPYKGLAEPYGLRACWSTPIFLDRKQVLGSFAMYYREVRAPDEDDIRLIDAASHLAGIAIERTRRERELTQHREHLEELVAARTAELTTALATLSLTQQELVRRDKLAALGALVAGVAHELNTPIGNSLVVATTMAEHVEALTADLAGGLRRSQLDGYLLRAQEASDILVRNLHRAADLVASFKQLAVASTSSERCTLPLPALFEELALPLRIATRHRRIQVGMAIDAGLTMETYPALLGQVLNSLFDNCQVHAFEGDEGGAIRIRAWAEGEAGIGISVADNGVGIPPELIGKVYDPFFTTRMGSGGSGLGLHVAHNIVTGALGGHIEVSSAPGQGTMVTLRLPRVSPASGNAP